MQSRTCSGTLPRAELCLLRRRDQNRKLRTTQGIIHFGQHPLCKVIPGSQKAEQGFRPQGGPLYTEVQWQINPPGSLPAGSPTPPPTPHGLAQLMNGVFSQVSWTCLFVFRWALGMGLWGRQACCIGRHGFRLGLNDACGVVLSTPVLY